MGFRYRKSINLGGGFRINLSKSGIGYSWGTRGYRVTRTSRGTIRRTYSIPGTGISYTQETGRINNRGNNRNVSRRNNVPYMPESYTQLTANTSSKASKDIKLGEEMLFQTVEAKNVVSSINRTIGLNMWGTILIFFVIFMLINPLFFVVPVVGIVVKILAHTSATVNLDYSFNAEAEEEHNLRIDAWNILAEGDKEWQINFDKSNANTTINGGTNASISRIICTIKKGRPFYIKTNVDTIEIKLQKETIVILPDKVFIIRGRKVGMVDYKDFNISVSSRNFCENEKVPQDACIIGSTWRFVNTNGTPNRRYKNNPRIPICLYGTVHLHSVGSVGLDVELMISNVQKVMDFRDLIE